MSQRRVAIAGIPRSKLVLQKPDSTSVTGNLSLTWGSVASKALACVSHSAAARMSASRMQPLLLLKANTLQCDGWKSAAVMTCRVWMATVGSWPRNLCASFAQGRHSCCNCMRGAR